ncbi:MAG: hypothetical protein IBX57_11040 [Gammaproteobacteria bacterium]|nr:hypothetical protein [Gammaproteobacteria bacterium]
MEKYSRNKPNKQHGAATLVISVVLLVAVTLVIIFASKVGVLDQRMSGNQIRHKEAFGNAEAGLEQAASYLRANNNLFAGDVADGWVACNGSTVFPCDITDAEYVFSSTNPISGSTATISTSVPSVIANATPYLVKTTDNIVAVGVGTTADTTGFATAQAAYVLSNLITPGDIPPVMAPSLNLNGNFTIVADPNNGQGSTGVPISGWTKTNISGTGTWQTCQPGEFKDGALVCTDNLTSGDNWSGCACKEALSDAGNINYDIFVDPDFPDPFAYIFGTSDSELIKARFQEEGKLYPGNCSGLDSLNISALKRPWIWVEGDCSIPSIGSATQPVIVVVGGKMTLTANTDAWGLFISLTEVKSNGAALIHGSLIADGDADITNGGYKQVYDEGLLEALADESINTDIARVKYSWRDF